MRFIKIRLILNRHEPIPTSLEAVLLQALSKNRLRNPMNGFEDERENLPIVGVCYTFCATREGSGCTPTSAGV